MAGEAILIVDDNATNLKLARVLLVGEGYEVRTAVDADEALTVLQKFSPRMILMDIQLPGMDGLELTRRLRADPLYQKIIILALTSFAMKGDEQKALAAGCDGYVTKPFDTRRLPKLIASYLKTASEKAAPTILVVEDNPTTLKMVRISLECEGYSVVEAHNAQSALDAADKRMPDLILQDLILPDMDGLELLGRLRALPGGAEIPILALSGFVSRLEETRNLAGGFNSFLLKPVEPSRLLETIRIYLPPPARLETGRPTTDYRVLVLDSDPIRLKLTCQQLSNLGFSTLSAHSESEAFTALSGSNQPHAVVIDAFLSGAGAFEFCMKLRLDSRFSHIPVILKSAYYHDAKDLEIGRLSGANQFLHPVSDIRELHDSLIANIQRGPTPPPPHAFELPIRDFHQRVIQQLDRQISASSGLVRRYSQLSAEISVIARTASALTRSNDLSSTLKDALAGCLDAVGVSRGAVYLREPEGDLKFNHAIGYKEADSEKLSLFFGQRDLFEKCVSQGTIVAVPSQSVPARNGRDLLASADVVTALIVPLVSSERTMGALLFGSLSDSLTDPEFISFAQAVSVQIGQSILLANTFAQLASSERRYRTLMENASDGIELLDLDGRILEVNQRAVEMYGVPKSELVGRMHGDLRQPALSADSRADLERLKRQGTSTTKNVLLKRPDGARIEVDFSASVVDLAGTQVILSMGHDVTERNQAEALVRSAEEQLRESQKMEAIGRLAGGIAHDFNNILAIISNCTDFLLDDWKEDDQKRKDVLQIRDASKRAALLVQQLLAFGKRQRTESKSVDINLLIEKFSNLFFRTIPANIRYEQKLNPAAGYVQGDPSQLEQVIMNLVLNARDAMPEGGTLTIETRPLVIADDLGRFDLKPGQYVSLIVSDTGIGMSKEIQAKIFEPFFTTKGLGNGTGLGLATVYNITKQAGGSVTVESEVGFGARFRVCLPSFPEPVENRNTTEILSEGDSKRETILLVEDEEAVRNVAKRILQNGGFLVLEAGSGGEALNLVEGHAGPIHLLLSDIMMPGMTGVELSRKLHEARRDIKTLFMSGYADIGQDRLSSEGEGGDELATEVIQKPFTRDALLSMIRKILAERNRKP